MGIFSKYLRAHKVEGLPETNVDKEASYIISKGKDGKLSLAVRNIDNNQWYTLEGLELGTTANTAAAGNHTHQLTEISGLVDALNSKEDKFTKNTAFNKNFGTTSTTVARGNHTHSQYLTSDEYYENHRRKIFIGTYLEPIITSTIGVGLYDTGEEMVITYQGATMPTIEHEDSANMKVNFIDMGIDFVPNQKCRIYLHVVDSLEAADELFIDITVKPITIL